MPKTILSIGFAFPGALVEYVPLTDRRSVLDADLVIFRPGFSGFYFNSERYKGWRTLSDNASFKFKEAAKHWRDQVRLAVQAGKTVVVFLPEREAIWVDSGERQYSGTGRNRQTTRILHPASNYDMLDSFSKEIVASEGESMKLTESGAILRAYWSEFEPHSKYKVIIREPEVTATIVTRSGDQAVGCRFRFGTASGRVLALPSLHLYDEDPSYLGADEDDSEVEWNKEDKRFGQKLLAALLSIDETLRRDATATPPPAWVSDDRYAFQREVELREAVLKADRQIETATARRAKLAVELEHEGKLRDLLFETGGVLELAIIDALTILGFAAERFRDADSEFDSVFVSAEGRFLGEAEGKDNKAIGIDKLRQLEMNVQEDLAREEVSEPARSVLFGNAFRFRAPFDRPDEFFTEKCLKAAARTGTAMVKTPDLFSIAKYLRERNDAEYAAACRRAMIEQQGSVVVFPVVPSEDKPPVVLGNAV